MSSHHNVQKAKSTTFKANVEIICNGQVVSLLKNEATSVEAAIKAVYRLVDAAALQLAPTERPCSMLKSEAKKQRSEAEKALQSAFNKGKSAAHSELQGLVNQAEKKGFERGIEAAKQDDN